MQYGGRVDLTWGNVFRQTVRQTEISLQWRQGQGMVQKSQSSMSVSMRKKDMLVRSVQRIISQRLFWEPSWRRHYNVCTGNHRCQGFWFVWSEKCNYINSEARRAELLGGSGGMPPQKIFKNLCCREAISFILGKHLLDRKIWVRNGIDEIQLWRWAYGRLAFVSISIKKFSASCSS